MSCYWDGFLERNQNNRILYKYGSLVGNNGSIDNSSKEWFCDLLIKNKLYFRDPSRFNDPFEFCSRLIIKDREKAQKKIEAAHLKRGIPADKAKRLSVDISNDPNFRSKIENLYRKKIVECGVYCLTTEWDNQLMWSQYADSHKGYCLVFVFKKDSPEYQMLRKVEYSDVYPEFVFEDDDFEDSGKKTCLTKSKCWSYENEFRMLSQQEGYLNSPTDSLEGIILGCKMDSNVKDFIFNLNNERNRPLRVFETYLDLDAYAIRIRDYSFHKWSRSKD